ncbi:hypothetical protein AB1Y20_014742 [Prymnesium parvum]|uniref:Uncharacterized protein n=1 Tax=Prymnesium parvum TaxID=97485 RepID=A0AB34IBR5_PRYPA
MAAEGEREAMAAAANVAAEAMTAGVTEVEVVAMMVAVEAELEATAAAVTLAMVVMAAAVTRVEVGAMTVAAEAALQATAAVDTLATAAMTAAVTAAEVEEMTVPRPTEQSTGKGVETHTSFVDHKQYCSFAPVVQLPTSSPGPRVAAESL